MYSTGAEEPELCLRGLLVGWGGGQGRPLPDQDEELPALVELPPAEEEPAAPEAPAPPAEEEELELLELVVVVVVVVVVVELELEELPPAPPSVLAELDSAFVSPVPADADELDAPAPPPGPPIPPSPVEALLTSAEVFGVLASADPAEAPAPPGPPIPPSPVEALLTSADVSVVLASAAPALASSPIAQVTEVNTIVRIRRIAPTVRIHFFILICPALPFIAYCCTACIIP